MKKLIISFTIALCTFSIMQLGMAQDCLPEGITFITQAQIDDFQNNYPGCTKIGGSVQIGLYDNVCDIMNLNGLNVLTSIGGDLSISNTLLTDLSGLDNLAEIDSTLWIYSNPNLASIASLSNLSYVSGSVYLGSYVWWELAGNPSLASLAGLEGLHSVDNLTIMGNDSLTDLTGLNNLQTVTGTLIISGNDILSSLTGLDNLAYIGGNLQFGSSNYYGPIGNPALNNVTGLEGLTEIGGSLNILGDGLNSFEGLTNLAVIGNNFSLPDNDVIPSLEGLDNLVSIGGNFQIGPYPGTGGTNYVPDGNFRLESLAGTYSLASIGGDLVICMNDSLTSLVGLANVTSIGGDLFITSNASLSTLAGLDNIDAGTVNNLKILNNSSLADCSAQTLCNYLAAPIGTVDINNNAAGCNNPPEIAEGCGMTIPCLPYGNYYFETQSEIDSFPADYPGCTELAGKVQIGKMYGVLCDIMNLDGFSPLTSIGGNLSISYNPQLSSLDGLVNISHIDGDFRIYENTSLASLAGLDNLDRIGGDFTIGKNGNLASLSGLDELDSIGGTFWFFSNGFENMEGLGSLQTIGGGFVITGGGDYDYTLTSLSGLDVLSTIGGIGIAHTKYLADISGFIHVTSVSGPISFFANQAMSSLAGLDNIEAGSIENIVITYNSTLSTCAVQSICEYLSNPNGQEAEIHDNDPGCDSPEEVEEACAVGVETPPVQSAKFKVQSYPNPTGGIVNLHFTVYNLQSMNLKIYNAQGQEVAMVLDEKLPAGEHTVRWDAGGLPAGIYYYRLTTDDRRLTTGTGKLVKY